MYEGQQFPSAQPTRFHQLLDLSEQISRLTQTLLVHQHFAVHFPLNSKNTLMTVVSESSLLLLRASAAARVAVSAIKRVLIHSSPTQIWACTIKQSRGLFDVTKKRINHCDERNWMSDVRLPFFLSGIDGNTTGTESDDEEKTTDHGDRLKEIVFEKIVQSFVFANEPEAVGIEIGQG